MDSVSLALQCLYLGSALTVCPAWLLTGATAVPGQYIEGIPPLSPWLALLDIYHENTLCHRHGMSVSRQPCENSQKLYRTL